MNPHKYLWRVSVRRVNTPIYLVAQNMASAHAQASSHPQVQPVDVTSLVRLAGWDDQHDISIVTWPEPPPPPEPEEPTEP